MVRVYMPKKKLASVYFGMLLVGAYIGIVLINNSHLSMMVYALA